jgi:hypothetical protein
MTWISLVCLLALSSSVFGQTQYGSGYGGTSFPLVQKILPSMRELTAHRRSFVPSLQVTAPVQYGYGQQNVELAPSVQQDVQLLPKVLNNYGSSYGGQTFTKALDTPINLGYGSERRFVQMEQPSVAVLTQADILCRGQLPETVIPLDDGRRFVVCLDESKGVEQECPKSLFYHPTSRRCERRLGPLENLCASQPCLNGGQCSPTEFSYQCQCAAGYDGKSCELDARVCQTQQPCGPEGRCQSFRWGAALSHICIFNNGAAYGFDSRQVVPSPCHGHDGPHALTITNKGFAMCDGDRLFIESCPGGTNWEDPSKACIWPDMEERVPLPQRDLQQTGYGSSYEERRPLITVPSYSKPIFSSRIISDLPKPIQSYGSSYGSEKFVERPQFEAKLLTPQVSSYGAQEIQKPYDRQPKFVQRELVPVKSSGY